MDDPETAADVEVALVRWHDEGGTLMELAEKVWGWIIAAESRGYSDAWRG